MPEAGVKQVQYGVLDTADIKVDTARILWTMLVRSRARPITLVFDIAECLIVAGIDVAQLVPGRTCPLRHYVGIAEVGLRAVTQVKFYLDPVAHLS